MKPTYEKPVMATTVSESSDGVRVMVMQVESGEHVVGIEFPSPMKVIGLDCVAAANFARGVAEAAAQALELNQEAAAEAPRIIVPPGIH